MAKKKTTVFRELVERDEILLRPVIALALHAQMVEAAGFEAVGTSGAGAAASIFGLPDVGLVTMSETVENIRRICSSVDIPVMADCDTGYGNPIMVRRTVQLILQAGAAALFIEDQVAPKRCGSARGKEVIPIEEAVSKFRAAVDERNEIDRDAVIVARTDARTAVGGSLDEAIRRAKAYREEGGVDAILMQSMQSREEIKKARASFDGPLACTTMDIKPQPTLKELQDLGMSFTTGLLFFEVGWVACWDMLFAMKQYGLDPLIQWRERTKDHPARLYRIFDLTGFPKLRQWEEMYLSREQLQKYDGSSGIYQPGKPTIYP